MSNAISYLAQLVGMPTLTVEVAANELALDFLEQFFAERGMHCQRWQFEGCGALSASTRKDNHKTATVCLSAHNDIVSGSKELFTMREQGGKLYGRGVFDMKFATAGYMQLVDELHQEGTLRDYDFNILITTDEELTKGYGKSGVSGLLRSGFRPRVAILPDSTAPGWAIEKVAKGWWRFDLIAKGISVHSARPWEGDSASMKLVEALHELKEHFKDHGPLTDSLNFGAINGEGVYNQVPDSISAKVEIRLASDQSWPKNKAFVDGLCQRHDLAYNTFSLVEPMKPILDDPLVDTYRDVVERVVGKRPEGHISLGGSDAPYFTEAGIPCIVSCPLGGKHHSEDEWLDKESFLQFVPILRAYLAEVADTPAVSVDKRTAKV
ncbi:MAG TPA: M20/M25/M40 family metallo-hydrolase [Candidatus Saccharimonadales bacterium]